MIKKSKKNFPSSENLWIKLRPKIGWFCAEEQVENSAKWVSKVILQTVDNFWHLLTPSGYQLMWERKALGETLSIPFLIICLKNLSTVCNTTFKFQLFIFNKLMRALIEYYYTSKKISCTGESEKPPSKILSCLKP